MAYEETLAIIKPHAVKEGWTDEIIAHYQAVRLAVLDRRRLTFTPDQAAAFYVEHEGKHFYADLLEATCEGECMAVALGGDDAVYKVRELNGATDPAKAHPLSLRAKFRGPGGPRNTVHGSDSAKAADREIEVIFDWKGG